MTTSCKYTKCQPGEKNGRGWGVIVFICDILGYTRHKLGSGYYGALLVPPACVYTFLFLCRDFFALDVTLVFIRVSGETFFFYLARLFFIRRDFFSLGATFFISRDFF